MDNGIYEQPKYMESKSYKTGTAPVWKQHFKKDITMIISCFSKVRVSPGLNVPPVKLVSSWIWYSWGNVLMHSKQHLKKSWKNKLMVYVLNTHRRQLMTGAILIVPLSIAQLLVIWSCSRQHIFWTHLASISWTALLHCLLVPVSSEKCADCLSKSVQQGLGLKYH